MKENVKDKIKLLVEDGLGMDPSIVIDAKRTPWRNNRPGIVKVQLASVDTKVKLLRQKMHLKNTDKYNRVFMHSSKSHEERLIELNCRELIRNMPGRDQYYFTGSGRLQRQNDDSTGSRDRHSDRYERQNGDNDDRRRDGDSSGRSGFDGSYDQNFMGQGRNGQNNGDDIWYGRDDRSYSKNDNDWGRNNGDNFNRPSNWRRSNDYWHHG